MVSNCTSKRITQVFIVFLSLVFVLGVTDGKAQADQVSTDPAVIKSGEELFNANCKACHRIDQKLVGPALKNVYDRRELSWIVSFVQNSQKLISSGDEDAIAIFEEYNKIPMTSFDTFEEDQILSIVAYVKDQTDNAPAPEAAVAETEGEATGEDPSGYLNMIMLGVLVVLIVLFIVLISVKATLRRNLKLKDGLSEDDQDIVKGGITFMELLRNKAFIGVVAAIFTAIVAKSALDGLFAIGVQQGYAPKQPISFSHKLHAGDFEIDCNYCHTGVMKSKNANIPSPNICMNCHSSIKTESPEIKKIYAAIENNQPIEWVRVHNLPDLSYFNHSQHVNVGGVECQTCHGPIEEMEVVRQHAKLTMGWCVNCHRETALNTDKNGYYDKLIELHEGDKPMTVEDNGGLDCAKCHY